MRLSRNLDLLAKSLTRGVKLDIALGDAPNLRNQVDDSHIQGVGFGHVVTVLDRERGVFGTDGFDDREPIDLVYQVRESLRVNYGHVQDEEDERVSAIRALPNWRPPEVGARIVVPSSYYIDHGEDDFTGGMATVAAISYDALCGNAYNRLMVEIKERPGWSKNWYRLIEDEEKNLETYGDQEAHEDPEPGTEWRRGLWR
jgi:hypothetical protein